MLHILWMIVKFIGIVLGILLGLVLLAILLVLFDPVRYRARVEKESEGLAAVKADARVSWLFGLISFRASYADGQPAISIRILGIPIEKLRRRPGGGKKSPPPSKPAKRTKSREPEEQGADRKISVTGRERPEGYAQAETPPEPALSQGIGAAEEESPGEDQPPEPQREEISREDALPDPLEEAEAREAVLSAPQQDGSAHEDAPSGSGLFSRLWGMLRTILGLPVRAVRFLAALPGKITAAIQKIRITIQNICDNISWWREFLADEHTRAAVLLVKGQAGGLIRHILPTRVSGNVTFGCADPSLTGRILAVLGMSFPLHRNRIAVTPLFDGENRLTGHVFVKGRIYGIVVLAAALKIYFNKNTKYVISQWKSKGKA